MKRYYIEVEVNCGIEVAVDADSLEEAEVAAQKAMLVHLDCCDGWDTHQREEPENRPVLVVGLDGNDVGEEE